MVAIFCKEGCQCGRHSEEAKRRCRELLKGRGFSEKHRKNLSEAGKGRIITEIHRDRLSARLKGKPRLDFVPWNKGRTGVYTEETRHRRSESVKQGWIEGKYTTTCQVPNKSEQYLGSILESYGFTFVGNRQLIIDGKCPDFWDGGTKIIELYGDHWHQGQDPQDRIDLFKRQGYDCLVIWESVLLKNKKIAEASIMAFVEV